MQNSPELTCNEPDETTDYGPPYDEPLERVGQEVIISTDIDMGEEYIDSPKAPTLRQEKPNILSPPHGWPEDECVDRLANGEGHASPTSISTPVLSPGQNEEPSGLTQMTIGDADAAFILGKRGKTKIKLSRVSGCRVNLKSDSVLELIGTERDRERAELYVKLIMQQRAGNVIIDFDPDSRDDCTCVQVPKDCVAFVTGTHGFVLRAIEEEWTTLIFFVKKIGDSENADTDRLTIFGNQRGRTGAELKVMSAIEQKIPGYFTRNLDERESDAPGFDTEIIKINEVDFSYALGRDGNTRRKLARAAGVIIEYIGKFAFFAGDLEARRRGKNYMNWLICQRTSSELPPVVESERDDVVTLEIPRQHCHAVAGPRGSYLRRLEETTGTFCFMDNKDSRLCIFAALASSRNDARDIVQQSIDRLMAAPRQRPFDGPYPARHLTSRTERESGRANRISHPREMAYVPSGNTRIPSTGAYRPKPTSLADRRLPCPYPHDAVESGGLSRRQEHSRRNMHMSLRETRGLSPFKTNERLEIRHRQRSIEPPISRRTATLYEPIDAPLPRTSRHLLPLQGCYRSRSPETMSYGRNGRRSHPPITHVNDLAVAGRHVPSYSRRQYGRSPPATTPRLFPSRNPPISGECIRSQRDSTARSRGHSYSSKPRHMVRNPLVSVSPSPYLHSSHRGSRNNVLSSVWPNESIHPAYVGGRSPIMGGGPLRDHESARHYYNTLSSVRGPVRRTLPSSPHSYQHRNTPTHDAGNCYGPRGWPM